MISVALPGVWRLVLPLVVVCHFSGISASIYGFFAAAPLGQSPHWEGHSFFDVARSDLANPSVQWLVWESLRWKHEAFLGIRFSAHLFNSGKSLPEPTESAVAAMIRAIVFFDRASDSSSSMLRPDAALRRRLVLFLRVENYYHWDSDRWFFAPAWLPRIVSRSELARLANWPFESSEALLKAERQIGGDTDKLIESVQNRRAEEIDLGPFY